jgi:hypothetical protein
MHHRLFHGATLVAEFLLAGIISSLECAEVSVAIVHRYDDSVAKVYSLPIAYHIRSEDSVVELKFFGVESTPLEILTMGFPDRASWESYAFNTGR